MFIHFYIEKVLIMVIKDVFTQKRKQIIAFLRVILISF